MDRFIWVFFVLLGAMDILIFTLGMFYRDIYHHRAEDYIWMAFFLVMALGGVGMFYPSWNHDGEPQREN